MATEILSVSTVEKLVLEQGRFLKLRASNLNETLSDMFLY